MLGYLSADIICSEKRSSRKSVSYEEQIMSKDKYPSIFSPQMANIVFIILQIFFATRTVLKIREYSRIFPSFRWKIFGHVTRLGQSRVSKKIWWIIINFILYYDHLGWISVVLLQAGMIRTLNDTFYINPLPSRVIRSITSNGGQLHVIYRRSVEDLSSACHISSTNSCCFCCCFSHNMPTV